MESRLFSLFPDGTNKFPFASTGWFFFFRSFVAVVYFVFNNVIIFPFLSIRFMKSCKSVLIESFRFDRKLPSILIENAKFFEIIHFSQTLIEK